MVMVKALAVLGCALALQHVQAFPRTATVQEASALEAVDLEAERTPNYKFTGKAAEYFDHQEDKDCGPATAAYGKPKKDFVESCLGQCQNSDVKDDYPQGECLGVVVAVDGTCWFKHDMTDCKKSQGVHSYTIKEHTQPGLDMTLGPTGKNLRFLNGITFEQTNNKCKTTGAKRYDWGCLLPMKEMKELHNQFNKGSANGAFLALEVQGAASPFFCAAFGWTKGADERLYSGFIAEVTGFKLAGGRDFMLATSKYSRCQELAGELRFAGWKCAIKFDEEGAMSGAQVHGLIQHRARDGSFGKNLMDCVTEATDEDGCNFDKKVVDDKTKTCWVGKIEGFYAMARDIQPLDDIQAAYDAYVDSNLAAKVTGQVAGGFAGPE